MKVDTFDLGALKLSSGEGRRFELEVELPEFSLAGERYEVAPDPVPVRLDISRTTAAGYALRLRFAARVEGPCMRCLTPAAPEFEVDTREVSIPSEGEELDSEYVEDEVLALADWAHDALALLLPATLLCRQDCAGLCPECGADLNQAGPEHHHDRPPDPRWAGLRELKLED